MKTNHKISILSILLLFATFTVYASNPVLTGRVNPASKFVVHQVNIMSAPELPLCGSYMIEIRNQAGQLVAPAQPFTVGKSAYYFFEKSDMYNGETVRTAMLQQVTTSGTQQCNYSISAQPVTVKGLFERGKVYGYDLFPKLNKIVKQ